MSYSDIIDDPFDHVKDAPWDRSSWHGKFISADGCETSEFSFKDIERLIEYGDTGDGWDGEASGIALLKDGRYIAWETGWGPTGSGFCHDAYGGDADIYFASTEVEARKCISESMRELWGKSATASPSTS